MKSETLPKNVSIPNTKQHQISSNVHLRKKFLILIVITPNVPKRQQFPFLVCKKIQPFLYRQDSNPKYIFAHLQALQNIY